MKIFLTIFCLFSLTIINTSAQQVDDVLNEAPIINIDDLVQLATINTEDMENNEVWQTQLQTAIRVHMNRLLESSVRRNNHEEVRELLIAGADPNTQAITRGRYNRELAVPVLQLAVEKVLLKLQ